MKTPLIEAGNGSRRLPLGMSDKSLLSAPGKNRQKHSREHAKGRHLQDAL